MALLDFKPNVIRRGKTASRDGVWQISLVPTRKIIQRIKVWAPRTLLVGFKLEAEGTSMEILLDHARRLLKESQADLVVANQLTEGEDRRHSGWILNREGVVLKKITGKGRLAMEIIKKTLPATFATGRVVVIRARRS